MLRSLTKKQLLLDYCGIYTNPGNTDNVINIAIRINVMTFLNCLFADAGASRRCGATSAASRLRYLLSATFEQIGYVS